MRKILTAAFILVSILGNTQKNLEINKSRNRISGQNTTTLYLHKKPPQFFTIPDSTRESVVVTLPQGGMPCIVPDMKKFNNMPNASKPEDLLSFKKPGAIPNPFFRQQKPKTKPFIKPNTDKEGS